MRWSSWRCVFVTLALLSFGPLWTADAMGADDALSRHIIIYNAPADCPTRSELEAKIRARFAPSWLSGADTRTFEVTIIGEAGGEFSGRLEVRRPGHDVHVRELRASTCAAVTTAIAVFFAIALDPTTEEDEPVAPEPSPVAAPLGPPLRVARPRPRTVPPLRRPYWTWSSSVHVTLLATPKTAWGARVYGELVRVSGEGRIAASARLSWGWSDFDVFADGGGKTDFRLRTARLEGCAHLALAPFTIAPCAAFDVGTLAGAAPDVVRSTYATTAWLSPGATVRVALRLASLLSIELEGALLVPLERKSFVLFDPYRFAYRAPSVLFEGGLGASLHATFF